MPKAVFNNDYQYLPHTDLLSFEEITRIAQLFVAHGVEKIRLTGGEPLLRKNIERLIAMLAELKTVSGKPLDLTLTTNASLLARKAQSLKDAGLQRVTVSLDALDNATFQRMNDVDFAVDDVLQGSTSPTASASARSRSTWWSRRHERPRDPADGAPLPRHALHPALHRIHGRRRVQRLEDGRSDAIGGSGRRISAEMPLEPVAANYSGETATRWRYADGSGEIGLISSVSQAFCADCTRARLSTEGKLYTCLFATSGHDLRALLREGRSDAEISTAGAVARARGPLFGTAHQPDRGPAPQRQQSGNVIHRGLVLSLKSKVTGLILAGGRGTRMGRVDKGLQPFRGATLASHVLARLSPQVATVAINANRNLPQYQAVAGASPVLPDYLDGFAGPLAGLQVGLQFCPTELLLTAPCDSPFSPPIWPSAYTLPCKPRTPTWRWQ
jgi:cyclic pyranopterin phosphate synthase